MKVQVATIEDAKEIFELQKCAYVSEAELHDDFNIPPLTQTIDELISEFGQKTILKITDGGAFLASGQVKCSDGCCYIGRMAVLPEFQGRGIGSKLLSALESVFPDAKRFELFTGENSEKNLLMYSHRGYVPFKTALLGKTKVIFLERIV